MVDLRRLIGLAEILALKDRYTRCGLWRSRFCSALVQRGCALHLRFSSGTVYAANLMLFLFCKVFLFYLTQLCIKIKTIGMQYLCIQTNRK